MERDLQEEFAFHVEMEARKLEAAGMAPSEARRMARLNFGGEERFKEKARESWGVGLLTDLLQDTRYAARSLRRSLGFASVAILTLGLGVGVTTAMFTVVNGVLARPLPFFEPDRLVAVGIGPPEIIAQGSQVLNEHFLEIRRLSTSFVQMATFESSLVTLTDAGEPVKLSASSVTAEFLEVLGVSPALGRGFSPGDDQPGAGPVVVLGDGLWRSRFEEDRGVIGTTATLDGLSRTIVGVMPPNFDFPARAGTDLWLPLDLNLDDEGHDFARPVVGRLGGDVSLEQATAELSALSADFVYPQTSDAPGAAVIPLRDLVVGDSRYPLLLFTGAVALVFLISCTNVANLLLMRAATREREIGVRRALGAGRVRLVRQLLTESLMVALLGGALGIVVAAVGVQALLALAPPGTIPRGQELQIDVAVLAFTLTMSALAGIGFGLAPAFRATRRELRDTIAEGARTVSPRGGLARGALVVAEVGLAVVLLTGAGLLLRSFQQIRAIDLGFQPANTLTFTVALPASGYSDGEAMATLHRQVLEGLARIPGVEVAGAGNDGPLAIWYPPGSGTRFNIQDATGARSYARATPLVVSPDYFRAMGILLRSGRAFTEQDDTDTPPVIVINRSMAEQFWPNRDPLGERLTIRNIEVSIVGVVADVVGNDVIATPGPAFYLPLAQEVDRVWQLDHMSYVVRTAASPRGLAPAMRAVLREAGPSLPPGPILSMDDVILSSMGERVFQTRILVVFAVLALLLAAVGIYGVTAYSVSERTYEIGIRMALGARGGQVAGMTLGRVLMLVIPGLVLGSAGGLAASRLIAASLYEIEPSDPVTFVGVALLLGGVAITAALVPARRATRVNPVEVLSR